MRYAVALASSWRLNDKTDFTFLSNFQSDPYAGYYGWPPRKGTFVPYYDANGSPYELPTDFNEDGDDDKMTRCQKMVGYNFPHALNDTFAVCQSLRYDRVKTLYRSMYGYDYIAPGKINRQHVRSDEDFSAFTVDTQLQFAFTTSDAGHTLLIDVDYPRMRNDVNALYGSVDPLDMNNPQYGNSNTDVNGPYARYAVLNRIKQAESCTQGQMEWDKWALTLGGRYDYTTTSVLTHSSSTLVEVNDQQFTWRGGVNYLFDNGVSSYSSHNESFEPTSGSTKEGKPFDPSRGKQYEAGVKYAPKDMLVVLTAVVYQLTKDKSPTAGPNDPAGLYSVQSGEIRSRGVELEVKAAVNANVSITATYGYTDMGYVEGTISKNKRPAGVPRNQASLWTDYTFYEATLNGLALSAGIRYTGSTVSYYKNDAAKKNDSFNVGGHTVTDATMKYDLARFGTVGSPVAVNVNNLFNHEYISSCCNEYACYWGAERQAAVTATFRF